MQSFKTSMTNQQKIPNFFLGRCYTPPEYVILWNLWSYRFWFVESTFIITAADIITMQTVWNYAFSVQTKLDKYYNVSCLNNTEAASAPGPRRDATNKTRKSYISQENRETKYHKQIQHLSFPRVISETWRRYT